MSIKDNIEKIKERIDNLSQKTDSSKIKLIAISKNHTAQEVIEAYKCGIKDFGENRIQEAEPKITEASENATDATWHLVGHLQSNKASKASKIFDWVHSIDKIETAIKLANHAKNAEKTIKILIEVNTSNEPSKNGISLEEVENFAYDLSKINNLKPSGLMTIGPLGGSEYENRKAFSSLRNKLELLSQTYPDYKELSMGMSGDYEEAILEGSTMIRIGTAMFGLRKY